MRQRTQLGERIRVVGRRDVARFERQGPLPEIVTVGADAVYEMLYDADGAISGAVLSELSLDVTAWREFIQELYWASEGIDSFFEQRVAPLEPPRVA
ncbi:DUF6879 family protein [Allokutzneria oryzae]|uniref:DUF6879 family protein n=1 Tax=Allokutzneria oryzae TaxID=1378989 RepID=A0ABV6A5F9_9PSEU